jgi:hypothetical protein
MMKLGRDSSSVEVYARCILDASMDDAEIALTHLHNAVEDSLQLVLGVRQEECSGVSFEEYAFSPKHLCEHQPHPHSYRIDDLKRKAADHVAVPVDARSLLQERVKDILGVDHHQSRQDNM